MHFPFLLFSGITSRGVRRRPRPGFTMVTSSRLLSWGIRRTDPGDVSKMTGGGVPAALLGFSDSMVNRVFGCYLIMVYAFTFSAGSEAGSRSFLCFSLLRAGVNVFSFVIRGPM